MTAQLPEFVQFINGFTPRGLQLDGTKISCYKERVEAWARGEKIAPVTMDVAWTRQCNAACSFCAAQFQASDSVGRISKQNALDFLSDAAEIGGRGVSLISDGESSVVPWYEESIIHGHKVGLAIGLGTNGVRLKKAMLEKILPHIAYLRFNISAGEKKRYSEIMGLKSRDFEQVVQNIKDAVEIQRRDKLPLNINMQMVTTPDMRDQIIPLTKLASEISCDYVIFKHCADDREGFLGVDYSRYDELYDTFQEALTYARPDFDVIVKWSRIKDEGKRDYERCYGTPFLLQLSGNGTLAPCGQFFQERFRKYHVGSIITHRFKDIWASDRYWEVVRYLSSTDFTAQQCGKNCVQTLTNSWLNKYVQGKVDFNTGSHPEQMEFL